MGKSFQVLSSKGLGLSQNTKQGVSAVSRNALFFGVGHYPRGIFYSSSSTRKLSGRTESILS